MTTAYRHDGGAGGITVICAECYSTRPQTPAEAEAMGLDDCEVALDWEETTLGNGEECDTCTTVGRDEREERKAREEECEGCGGRDVHQRTCAVMAQ